MTLEENLDRLEELNELLIYNFCILLQDKRLQKFLKC